MLYCALPLLGFQPGSSLWQLDSLGTELVPSCWLLYLPPGLKFKIIQNDMGWIHMQIIADMYLHIYIYKYTLYIYILYIPVVPHKAVAEVSK